MLRIGQEPSDDIILCMSYLSYLVPLAPPVTHWIPGRFLPARQVPCQTGQQGLMARAEPRRVQEAHEFAFGPFVAQPCQIPVSLMLGEQLASAKSPTKISRDTTVKCKKSRTMAQQRLENMCIKSSTSLQIMKLNQRNNFSRAYC